MKILVICGGESSERNISLRSGEDIYEVLKDLYSTVEKIDLSWSNKDDVDWKKYDFIVNALHGGFGEGGEIQEYLEQKKVPFLGEGSTVSNLLFDKWKTKKILNQYRYQLPDGFLISQRKIRHLNELNCFFPCVIKPLKEGSSIGVLFLEKKGELENSDLKYDEYLCERYIKGTEISVCFFFGEILPIIEIRKKGPLFDYETKYSQEGQEILHFLERDSQELPQSYEEIEQVVLNICRDLEIRTFCRLDIIVNETGIYILEINTIPGLKRGSLLPKMAEKKGVKYKDFIQSLIVKSLELIR